MIMTGRQAEADVLDAETLVEVEAEFTLCESTWGEYHQRTIAALQLVADCNRMCGRERYPRMIGLLRAVVERSGYANGPLDKATLIAQHNLAQWLSATDAMAFDSAGQLEAMAIWCDILPLQEQVMGEGTGAFSTSLRSNWLHHARK
jgi:hypothetical protein